jgi:hypothetical protein
MSVKNTSLRLTLMVLLGILLIVTALIIYKDFSNKEEAREFLNKGKKVSVTINNKRIDVTYSSGRRRPRSHYSYIVSGFINVADNSKLGKPDRVDSSPKVDLAKNQFGLPDVSDFSKGFKINLEIIDMSVTKEMYDKIKEGDEVEAYYLKIGDKHSCMAKERIDSFLK